MKLLLDTELEKSAVVANCRMNRQRDLHGSNGYDVELRFDPVQFLLDIVRFSSHRPIRWLDLCCGSAKALGQAAEIIQKRELPITITGVDLVGMFAVAEQNNLTLVQASLNSWTPDDSFDLITCVHGIHYLGDKLTLLSRCGTWLSRQGKFVASFDPAGIKLEDRKTSQTVTRWLRGAGFEISNSKKLITSTRLKELHVPFEYLGADANAGPNYTGQPAVNSHYRMADDRRNT